MVEVAAAKSMATLGEVVLQTRASTLRRWSNASEKYLLVIVRTLASLIDFVIALNSPDTRKQIMKKDSPIVEI